MKKVYNGNIWLCDLIMNVECQVAALWHRENLSLNNSDGHNSSFASQNASQRQIIYFELYNSKKIDYVGSCSHIFHVIQGN